MTQRRTMEIAVGLLMVLGLVSLGMLALKVSGLQDVYNPRDGFEVNAYFENAGGLKPRARVSVAGVTVGRVKSIMLDEKHYEAKVALFINKGIRLPIDSSASILTAGLIGDNYVSLQPGSDTAILRQGSIIDDTQSAVILERLIGQLIYQQKKGNTP